ncbi:hypothetical protein BDZ89DRAFT_1044266 [Hymenopellis radicata]|nr:hypothetical protein BDZ89DRAFT_1044266 [Hymenopellis radicata]
MCVGLVLDAHRLCPVHDSRPRCASVSCSGIILVMCCPHYAWVSSSSSGSSIVLKIVAIVEFVGECERPYKVVSCVIIGSRSKHALISAANRNRLSSSSWLSHGRWAAEVAVVERGDSLVAGVVRSSVGLVRGCRRYWVWLRRIFVIGIEGEFPPVLNLKDE